MEWVVSSSTDFSGLWVPLVTPFRRGRVDLAAADGLVRHLRAAGVTGFVVCGSTGEAAALDEAEQLALLETVLAASDGRPVVMGLSGYHLPDTRRWIATLCQRPIAGLLVPPPIYIRPSQAGVLRWFHSLADAARVPLIVYDIPYRCGVTLHRDTLLQLARHPGIRAIKDCASDPAKTLAVLAQGSLQVLAGEDQQIFSALAQGAHGAIAASAHLEARRFVDLVDRLRAGDLPAARTLWHPLVPWIELAFSEPNPCVIKAALAQQGLLHNELREPMTRASPAARSRLRALHAAGATV